MCASHTQDWKSLKNLLILIIVILCWIRRGFFSIKYKYKNRLNRYKHACGPVSLERPEKWRCWTREAILATFLVLSLLSLFDCYHLKIDYYFWEALYQPNDNSLGSVQIHQTNVSKYLCFCEMQLINSITKKSNWKCAQNKLYLLQRRFGPNISKICQ